MTISTVCVHIRTEQHSIKRTVLNALSKLMDTAAWLSNQCFLQSAIVEFEAVICNDFGKVSSNWRNHELFSRYNSILFIINKLKVISTPFGCVKLSSVRTASH